MLAVLPHPEYPKKTRPLVSQLYPDPGYLEGRPKKPNARLEINISGWRVEICYLVEGSRS